MSTLQAIKQCGKWAYKASVPLHENPFLEAVSYRKAWAEGWEEQYKIDTQKDCNVATI